MKSQWMIYGANGYSAQLAIEKAVEQSKTPILAGRNQAEIEALGKKFDLPVRIFDLSSIDKLSSVIPWGDLVTAHWQTNIPNISVYLPFTGSKLEIMLFPVFKLIMSIPFVRKRAVDIAGRTRGPNATKRANNRIYVWGEIKNASGKVVTAGIEVPDGYTVTMNGIIMSADYCRDYQGEGGCYTPSQLMGHTLAEQLPGASSITLRP